MSAADADVTEDRLLGGRLILRQPARGYRLNVDTVLLAAAVGVTGWGEEGSRLFEAGCGVGGALLCAAHRLRALHGQHHTTRYIGVEREARYAELARRNVEANGFSDCVEIIQGDALEVVETLGILGGVFFNPPYDLAGKGQSPSSERHASHVADQPIDAWIKVFSNRLTGYGALTLIHRAEMLPEIIAALEGRLGGVEVIPIRPKATAPARRVIVRARKGSRAPLRLYGGYDLHDDSGAKYTPEVDAILRGEAQFGWL